jgi:hypothetical protein
MNDCSCALQPVIWVKRDVPWMSAISCNAIYATYRILVKYEFLQVKADLARRVTDAEPHSGPPIKTMFGGLEKQSTRGLTRDTALQVANAHLRRTATSPPATISVRLAAELVETITNPATSLDGQPPHRPLGRLNRTARNQPPDRGRPS